MGTLSHVQGVEGPPGSIPGVIPARELLGLVDFPVLSETFAPGLTGKSDLQDALREIQGLSAGNFACATLGRGGALVVFGDQTLRVHAPEVKAVDTTGAGDVFHGGFVFGIVSGWGLEETLRYATAAAATNCTAYGARGGIQGREKLQKLAQTIRVEAVTLS